MYSNKPSLPGATVRPIGRPVNCAGGVRGGGRTYVRNRATGGQARSWHMMAGGTENERGESNGRAWRPREREDGRTTEGTIPRCATQGTVRKQATHVVQELVEAVGVVQGAEDGRHVHMVKAVVVHRDDGTDGLADGELCGGADAGAGVRKTRRRGGRQSRHREKAGGRGGEESRHKRAPGSAGLGVSVPVGSSPTMMALVEMSEEDSGRLVRGCIGGGRAAASKSASSGMSASGSASTSSSARAAQTSGQRKRVVSTSGREGKRIGVIVWVGGGVCEVLLGVRVWGRGVGGWCLATREAAGGKGRRQAEAAAKAAAEAAAAAAAQPQRQGSTWLPKGARVV